MKRKGKLALTLLVAFLLSSCTIAHFEIKNELNVRKNQEHEKACNFKYLLFVTSSRYTHTFGENKPGDEVLRRLKFKYSDSARKVMESKGCMATNVDSKEDANFIIHVDQAFWLSALPQEWLTGLSFGLIPSWGTRPAQMAYLFMDTRTGRKHTYFVDQKSYNHIVLFPIFWISFITLDELKVFEKSLENFIGGT